MTYRKRFFMVVLGYLVVAGVEIALHWLLTQTPFQLLLRIYLLSNYSGNSGMSIFVDLLIPACLLGYWNGRLGREPSSQFARWLAVPLAAGIVALYPLYNALIRKVSPVWWWPKSTSAALYLFTLHLLVGVLIILGITMDQIRRYGRGGAN